MNFLRDNWYIFAGLGFVVVVVLAAAAAIKNITQKFMNRFIQQQKDRADNIVKLAEEEARTIRVEAKAKALTVMQESETEVSRRRNELSNEEERLQRRRTEMDKRLDSMEQRDKMMSKRQSAIDKRANDAEKLFSQQMDELHRIAQMSTEEARTELLAKVETDARNDMARIIRQIDSEARSEGEKRAREIIASSIQRIAADHVADVCSSVITLPNEEMKGRIVGRNGRNIRAFEQAAGVDVIVDDTPESVTVSCFDPVRREIARRSLDRLIQDGRIHPAYIEKVLAEEEKAVQKSIIEAGEQAAYEAGVVGLHPEILKTMGRLKYRTSYGQNQLSHAIETSKLAAIIASELGANVEVSRLAAFLHDLGKALDHNTDGTHASIGADFAKRYGVNAAVINAIASHHHELDQESVEAVIVESADAISGARPGARREDLEQYIKRLKALEEIANTHDGVAQSYAIQAGREVRIMVRPEEIDDLASINLARDIARQIEENMQYPGQIKVTVIRETRAVDFAK